MELYVVAAGHMDSLIRWQQDLTAQFLPVYKNGKKTKYKRRLLVAPVQLYKIAFPKEEIDNVIAAVHPGDYMIKRHKFLGVMAAMFRKLMKFKKVPERKFTNPLLQPNNVDKAVAVMPIGIKEDMTDSDGYESI